MALWAGGGGGDNDILGRGALMASWTVGALIMASIRRAPIMVSIVTGVYIHVMPSTRSVT